MKRFMITVRKRNGNFFPPTVAEVYVFIVSDADRATEGPTIVEMALICTCDATLVTQLQTFWRVAQT